MDNTGFERIGNKNKGLFAELPFSEEIMILIASPKYRWNVIKLLEKLPKN